MTAAKLTSITVVLVLLVGFGVSHLTSSGSSDLWQQGPAPAIEQQALTRNQEEHGRLFAQYGTGKKLRDLSARGHGDVEVVVGISPPIPLLSPNPRPEYPSPYLIDIGCATDVVVVGVLRAASPHLTQNEEFLFTDYTMQVDQVLKDNGEAPIHPGTDVIVTRVGGVATINKRVVRAIDPQFPNFTVGKRYLLFLRYIRVTRDYEAFDEGSFGLENNKVLKLTRRTQWSGKLFRSEDESTFITEVSNAIASKCVSKKNGDGK